MTTPSIKPIKIPELDSKQSKYQFSGSLPTRSLIFAPRAVARRCCCRT